MMKEAEAHAEEDKKRKEEIETRNRADQSVYAAERMLHETGDKLAAADRQAIEGAIASLKQSIEANDMAGIGRGLEQLTAAQHSAAESLYRQGQPAGGSGASSGPEPSGDSSSSGSPDGSKNDVIDAEVVDEEKR